MEPACGGCVNEFLTTDKESGELVLKPAIEIDLHRYNRRLRLKLRYLLRIAQPPADLACGTGGGGATGELPSRLTVAFHRHRLVAVVRELVSFR